MSRRFFTIGTFLAFLAVAAGALGAHAVRDRLTPGRAGLRSARAGEA